jgi:hypothetical protein
MPRCRHVKDDGSRCKLLTKSSNGLCFSHDPKHAGHRKRTAARGGAGRGGSAGEIVEIKAKLRKIADDLLDPNAKLPRGDAAVAIQAYTAVMNCIRTELKQREQEELVERLESLESALAQRKQGYG